MGSLRGSGRGHFVLGDSCQARFLRGSYGFLPLPLLLPLPPPWAAGGAGAGFGFEAFGLDAAWAFPRACTTRCVERTCCVACTTLCAGTTARFA